MKAFVYALIDPVTLLVRYVGRTIQGHQRFVQHRYAKNQTHVSNWVQALRAQGLNFIPVVLEHCSTKEELLEREAWWVAYGRLSGWELTNLTDGGDGSWGYTPTQATRAKLRALHLGKPKTEAHRESMRKAKSAPDAIAFVKALHTGRKRTDSTKAKIGAASRRRVVTEEARENMRMAALARAPRTQATRAKLSAALKGRKRTPEQVARMSAAQQGKTASIETRKRMSEAHKRRWAERKR